MKKMLLVLSCSVLLFACKKDDDNNCEQTQILSYKQTYCADPWGIGDSDSATLVKMRQYLDSRGLYHSQESITLVEPPSMCLACTCTSGKIIKVATRVGDQQAYTAFGFMR